ncbi:MAG: hypothetical protein MSC30_04175 [Gaiellaceae bacterium MAG52_C11]|nr:hypothetical protein [Candidatus Gaiellasilicea maunaloa]
MVKSEKYRSTVTSQNVPELAARFLAAAAIAEADRRTAEGGWLALRAAWACDDEENLAGSALCRERALERFRRSGDRSLGCPDRKTGHAVVADVLRRIGRFGEALDEYDLGLLAHGNDQAHRVLEVGRRLTLAEDAKQHTLGEQDAPLHKHDDRKTLEETLPLLEDKSEPDVRRGVAPVLNAELFRDQEAYNEAANNLLMSAERPRPSPLVTTAGANLLSRLVNDKEQKRWAEDILEVFGVAYAFVQAESWDALDRNRAEKLMNEGLEAVRQQRLRTDDEPISLQDPDNRVTNTALGLVGEHQAFAALRSYVYEQPTHNRLEHLREIYQLAGIAMGDVKRRHMDRFQQIQLVAWRFGVALGLLDLLGEVPESP